MLEVRDVKKKYRGNHAVKGISFTLQRGDVLGLLGANGAGKSTTISMIATLITPDEGDIFFEGDSITAHPKKIRKRLGYVPQDIALYETLTGMDNLRFWGRSYGLNKQQLKDAIAYVMPIMRLTDSELGRRVNTYSGGMKRRLNIGAALLHHPDLVLMDEPTVGLDLVSRNVIIEAIKEINHLGVSIIYTGHYFEEIEEISNQILILNQGSVAASDSMEAIRRRDMSLEAYYLKTIAGDTSLSHERQSEV